MDNDIKPELIKDLGLRFTKEGGKQRYRYGLYKCPYCDTEFEIRTYLIIKGKQKSCGCLTTATHGLRSHRLYKTWAGMKHRCYNEKNPKYKHYGARGIEVCERWLDVKNFIEDMYSSFEEGLTLDRIDVDGDYEPDNCRWATLNTQARNTRKIMSTNKSGYRGVYWDKNNKKWRTQIRVNGKNIHIGMFNDLLEGAKAYDQYVIDNNLEHTKNFLYE